MNKLVRGILLIIAIFALAGEAFAVPNLLQYNGRLTDATGNPLNGAQTVTFTIYADSLGVTQLWTETRSVTTVNGLFALTLGTGTVIGASVFDGSPRFLGIKVAPDAVDLLPRQRISSSAYALRSGFAEAIASGTGTVLMKKVTGTTGATQGDQVAIATGVAPDKILSITVMVSYLTNAFVPEGYTNNPGYQFNWYESGGNVWVWTTSGNSANILNRLIKVFVTYEP